MNGNVRPKDGIKIKKKKQKVKLKQETVLFFYFNS